MSVVIQGKAAEYNKVFESDGQLWMLKSGCFGSVSDVDLLIAHKGKSFANTEDENRLMQVHSGDTALVFRCHFPEWFAAEVKDQVNEIECYVAVSTGFTITKTETVVCDDVPVRVILEAKLSEISLLDKPPAIDTTYARVCSDDTCGTLADDFDRIITVGRFVGLHRKVKATENDGVVRYAHSPSAMDRAANKFMRLLSAMT